MKQSINVLIMLPLLAFLLAACGDETNTNETGDNPLQVVASFTIISDMAREIGGDKVNVHNLVPTGTDPHEYEPLPQDSKKAADADVLFYNGMNLEGGSDGWFFKMMASVGQDETNAFSLTERVEPMYITDTESNEEEVNPHAFIDPTVGIKMAEDLRDALIEVDPDNEAFYADNATTYIKKLTELDQQYADRINSLPDDNKTLVTSECAFQYMLSTYGMKEGCIWKVDTDENGSPEQITSLIEFIEENNVETLFVESNVDERPMETVSNEAGVPIFEKPIFSDEIGMPGDEIDTYIKYLQYNIDIIHEGLSN